MAVYENVPLIELEGVLQNYIPCWGAIEFVGIAIREGERFFPVGMQMWDSDETEEQTTIYDPQTLHDTLRICPDDLRMYHVVKRPPAAVSLIKRLFDQESIHVADIQLDFEQYVFGRAAFLGSRDYDTLYAKERNPRVKGWPKLFLEGGIQNRQTLEKTIRSIEQELGKADYKFHTLRDASNYLLHFPFSPAYYMGGIESVAQSVRAAYGWREASIRSRVRLPKPLDIQKRMGKHRASPASG